MSFTRASSLSALEVDGRSCRAVATFDPTWSQGPGVFGGLTAAALARGMAPLAKGRPLRSLALQYCAPATPASCGVEATLEREGARSSFVSARLVQGGEVQVMAHGMFAGDRPADLDHHDLVCPDPVDPERLPALPYVEGLVPVFTQHVDFRFVAGVPFGGGRQSRLAAWVRFRSLDVVDRPALVGLMDVMPPALLARANGPRAMSTATFQLHLLADCEAAPIPADSWFFLEVRSDETRAGWSDESITLLRPAAPDPTQRVVGRACQLRALIR